MSGVVSAPTIALYMLVCSPRRELAVVAVDEGRELDPASPGAVACFLQARVRENNGEWSSVQRSSSVEEPKNPQWRNAHFNLSVD